MQTLQKLILDRKAGRTYAQLSDDCGGKPTDKRLNQIVMNGINEFPDPVTIEGLARGLRTSVTNVVLASARSLDLDVEGHDSGALVLENAARLPVSSQNALISVAHEMVECMGMVTGQPLR